MFGFGLKKLWLVVLIGGVGYGVGYKIGSAFASYLYNKFKNVQPSQIKDVGVIEVITCDCGGYCDKCVVPMNLSPFKKETQSKTQNNENGKSKSESEISSKKKIITQVFESSGVDGISDDKFKYFSLLFSGNTLEKCNEMLLNMDMDYVLKIVRVNERTFISSEISETIEVSVDDDGFDFETHTPSENCVVIDVLKINK